MTIWYWQYAVKVWDEIDQKYEVRSGVVPATSMAEAMADLEEYYGDDIVEVQMLKSIHEGYVFEFQLANEENDFDYTINKKV